VTPGAALERARRRASAPTEDAVRFERAVAESVAYLESDQAERDIERDPYWPKWVSPWWHMVLLHELGLVGRIPRRAARLMAEAMDAHFLHEFPLRLSDVPRGLDPFRHIVCHCALGSMFRVLHDCGVDVEGALGWARPWFLRYQLSDGGLNCDEAAYLRPTPRSSFVSTLPPAEAVLLATDRPLEASERAFLAGVASYLVKRRLVRSLSRDQVVDPDWLEPCFPRFYFYDALRGLRFLANWADRCSERVPAEAIEETIEAIDGWFEKPSNPKPRQPHRDKGTYAPGADGTWRSIDSAPSFALLEQVAPAALRHLEREWVDTLELLRAPGVVV
jgi:hypothetical protein